MLIKAPVFVNGFNGSGSSICVNILQSHPDVCRASAETHYVIQGNPRYDSPAVLRVKRFLYAAPLRWLGHQPGRVFMSSSYLERQPFSFPARRLIDLILYVDKMFAARQGANRLIREGERSTLAQRRASRLVTKNVGGVTLMSDVFRQIWPDARFINLVRHGLALCEGHLRRGVSASEFGRRYAKAAGRMYRDSIERDDALLVQFESILADPLSEIRRIYRFVGLDLDAVEKMRFQREPTLDDRGQHVLKEGKDGQLIWYAKDRVRDHFDPDIDARQIRHLAAADRKDFLEHAAPIMTQLGYDWE